MPAVLETDDTKAWHIYKETDEVKQTFENIHSYMKGKQMIYTHTKEDNNDNNKNKKNNLPNPPNPKQNSLKW